MKDFDQVRAARSRRVEDERAFMLAGERFVLKPSVRPDAIMQAGSLGGKEPNEMLADIDAAIIDAIERHNDAVERYRALRRQEDDAVTLEDLLEVTKWMVEVVTGRPTSRPSDSSNGGNGTDSSLTVVSSSPAIPEASTA